MNEEKRTDIIASELQEIDNTPEINTEPASDTITPEGKFVYESDTIEIHTEITDTVSDMASETVHAEPINENKNEYENQTDSYKPYEVFYTEDVKSKKPEKKTGSFKKFIAGVLVASIVGGTFVGAGFSLSQNYVIPFISQLGYKNESVSASSEGFSFDNSIASQLLAATGNASSAADIIDMVTPSVVNITSMVEYQSYYGFRFNQGTQEAPASGSGIIFHEKDGIIYIVTNYHVIDNANSVSISIGGEEQIPAEYVGGDSQNELAVISIKKSDLIAAGITDYKIAKMGNSDNLRVGDVAIAIGNALGEGKTATMGIISAVNKTLQIQDKNLNVLQTDAAINPGNSGGPLVNANGEVIGINTAKLSESSVEGMGFSIPINVAKPIIEDIMNNGQSVKPYLGIMGQDIDSQTAETYKVPMGVLVAEVIQNSGAAVAGIKRNDIITEFGGTQILTMEDLTSAIQKRSVGDKIDVKIVRNGTEQMTVTVVLQDANKKW